MRNKILSLTVFLMVLMFAINVFAFSIGIDKPSFHVQTNQGESKKLEIIVYNFSDEQLAVNVSVEDWIYKKDRSKKFLPKGKSPYSCGKWIKPEKKKFNLKPKEKKKFYFTIKTPRKAKGGHQAVLFFEAQPSGKDAKKMGSGILFSGKIGSIIYQETKGNTINKGNIKDASYEHVAEGVKVEVLFENKGNNCLQAKGNVILIDKSGSTIARKDVNPLKTLPGETDTTSVLFTQAVKLVKGEHKFIVTLDTGSEILVQELDVEDL